MTINRNLLAAVLAAAFLAAAITPAYARADVHDQHVLPTAFAQLGLWGQTVGHG